MPNKSIIYLSIIAIAIGLIFLANGLILAFLGPSASPPTGSGAISVDSAGNVGIGTTNPSQKLDVAGQIHATLDVCTDAGGGVCLSAAGVGGVGACSDCDARFVNEGQANSITSGMIQDGQVQSADITDGTVGSADINSSQVQRRVSGTCPAGQAIRVISSTGTVTCQDSGTRKTSTPLYECPAYKGFCAGQISTQSTCCYQWDSVRNVCGAGQFLQCTFLGYLVE